MDIHKLENMGFSQSAISDAAQVVGFFNYINRIAEGLGVDLEPEMNKLCVFCHNIISEKICNFYQIDYLRNKCLEKNIICQHFVLPSFL